jgi:glucose-fructose oxidoreductase
MQSYNGVTGITSDGKKFEPIQGMQQTLQMDNDALAILTDRQPLVTGSEGLADIHIVDAIFRAAQTGKTVAV